MPEYQLIEKNIKIAKRNFFDFVCFRSGLIIDISDPDIDIDLVTRWVIKLERSLNN